MTLIFPGMTMRHQLHGLVLVRWRNSPGLLHSYPRDSWTVRVLTGEFRNALQTVSFTMLTPEFLSEEWL